MTSTTFTAGTVVASTWLNDVNSAVYKSASGTSGTINRTLIDKLKEFVSVKDFGAVGDGVTDDTTAIQAALNSSAKYLYIPSGTYLLSALLQATHTDTRIVGASRNGVILRQSNTGVGIFSDAGYGNTRIENVSFSYTGIATAGAVLSLAGFYSSADNFTITNPYIGIKCPGTIGTNVNSVGFNNFQIIDAISISMQMIYAFNVNVSNFFIIGGDNTTKALQGHLVMSHGQGNNFVTGEIYNGVSSGSMDLLQFCKFDQVYFDSGATGPVITTCTALTFNNCWFSNGRSGGGNPGITVGVFAGTDTSDSISFNACSFVNCGGDGALVYAGPTRVAFDNCIVNCNSSTAGANVKHGLEFASNCNYFSVTNCQITNSTGYGIQRYGIFINGGTSLGYVISGNNLIGNGTGPLSDNGTSSSRRIVNNIGYINGFRGTLSIANGTSSTVVTHGLSVTPAIGDIILMPNSDINLAGITRFWVSAVSSTTFTVTVNAVTSAIQIFTWDARSAGA